MSILSVANVHFETTGANRIDYIAADGDLRVITTGNISFSSRNFSIANSPGASGNVLTSDGTSWVSQAPVVPTPRVNTVVISTNTNAASGNHYVATATLTLTLPGLPSIGDIVGFSNPTINITSVIARNSANILGLAEDLTFDKANAAVVLQYSGADKGWVFV